MPLYRADHGGSPFTIMPSLHAVILGIALGLGLGGGHAASLAAKDARQQLLYRPKSAPAAQPLRPVALSPHLNLTPEQLAIAARPSQLSFAAKLEYSALDTRPPVLESARPREGLISRVYHCAGLLLADELGQPLQQQALVAWDGVFQHGIPVPAGWQQLGSGRSWN